MHTLRTLALTTLLASTPLAPATFAQGSKPQSPRELLARAAYVEEHEHDLDAAAAAYRAAAEAAAAAGDKAVAQEAQAALARVAVRQGKAPATPLAQQQDALRAMRWLLVDVATESWADPVASDFSTISNLALYGDALVPYARAMLDPKFAGEHAEFRTLPQDEGGTPIVPNTHLAARLLGALDTPEARAVLEAAYGTPDPVVRHTIVRSAKANHVALLCLAAEDRVPGLRQLALERLRNTEDVSASAVMEHNALLRDPIAVDWLARIQPLRALSVLDEILTTDGAAEWRNHLNFVADSPRFVGDVPTVEALLRLAGEARHSSVREVARQSLGNVVSRSRQGRSVPPEIESALLRGVERSLSVPALNASRDVDALKLVAAITRGARLSKQPFSDAELSALGRSLNSATSEALTAQDWRAAFDALAPRERWTVDARDIRPACDVVVARLEPLYAAARDARTLVGWFDAMPAPARERYRDSLGKVLWAMMFPQGGGGGRKPAPLDRSLLPVVDLLVQSLQPSDPRTQSPRDPRPDMRVPVLAWSAIGDPALLERLLDVNTMSRGNDDLALAGRTLVAADPERAEATLWTRVSPALGKELLDSSDWSAVFAIAWLPAEAQLPFFQRAHSAASTQAARSGLVTLLVDHLDGPGATAELVRLYPTLEIDAPTLRLRAIQRFTKELFEPAIPLLGEALKSNDEDLRSAARMASDKFREQREALEEFASWTAASKAQQDAVVELTALLASPNRDVVLGAVKALAAVKAKSALPALVKLLAGDDAELKRAVRESIDKLGQ